MSNNEALDISGNSLADLAGIDTSGMAAMTSRLPEVGIYLVRGKEVELTRSESNDPAKPPLHRVNWKTEILAAQLHADSETDPDDIAGRDLNHSDTLWPDDMKECIQLVMGRYKTVGLPFQGTLGGVEGHEPGWLDSMVGHMFRIRVRHATTKDGNQRAYYDWQALTEEELAEINA
jgi:hypothetical protein